MQAKIDGIFKTTFCIVMKNVAFSRQHDRVLYQSKHVNNRQTTGCN